MSKGKGTANNIAYWWMTHVAKTRFISERQKHHLTVNKPPRSCQLHSPFPRLETLAHCIKVWTQLVHHSTDCCQAMIILNKEMMMIFKKQINKTPTSLWHLTEVTVLMNVFLPPLLQSPLRSLMHHYCVNVRKQSKESSCTDGWMFVACCIKCFQCSE